VFATIDSGTTNSRVYLLDDRLQILAKGVKQVGVRDTAITGSRQTLREGLSALLLDTLRQADRRVADLECAIASGMITSEIGLLEIPHLSAPAGREELAQHLRSVRDPHVLPVDLELVFIPGIKNAAAADAGVQGIRRIDFMRGEETQVMGLLTRAEIPPPLTAVVLSSHTKYIAVAADRRIAGSLTTLSGQIFEAVRQSTSIGKSIAGPELGPLDLDAEIIRSAYDAVVCAGFLRALLMPRFLEVLLDVPAPKRRLFLEAAIATEDLVALDDFPLLGLSRDVPFVLVGRPERCALFGALLERRLGPGVVFSEISSAEDVDWLSIRGAVAVAQRAGYLKRCACPSPERLRGRETRAEEDRA